MLIHGRECGFMLTVGASIEIAKMCPGGDLARIGEMFEHTNYADTLDFIIDFAVALNKGYSEHMAFESGGFDVRPLTAAELRALPPSALAELQREAMASFTSDAETSIEVKPEKKTDENGSH